MLHPDDFLFQALPIWNAFTERLVAASPAASRPPLYHFSYLKRLYLSFEPPRLISLCHLITGPFVSQPPFTFQVWPDLSETKTKSFWRAFGFTNPLMLPPTSPSKVHWLLAPLLPGTLFSLLWSPLHALSMAALLLFLLTTMNLAYLPTVHFVALRSLFPFRQAVYSRFFAKACTILQALHWSRQYQQLCHFSSPPLRLSLCPLFRLSFYRKLYDKNRILPPLLSSRSMDTHFSRGTTRLMSWPGKVRYSCPLQSLVVSLPYLSNPLYSFLGLEAYCLI